MADSPLERGAWWNRYYMPMADHVATASKDPSTKVGCVLVDERRRVIGTGYNGFPRGVKDDPSRYEDRAVKYLMVQHAEANAVLNAVSGTEGSTAYVTHFPCSNCAGVLIQAGIRRIFTTTPDVAFAERFKDSFNASYQMLSEAGVQVNYMDPVD